MATRGETSRQGGKAAHRAAHAAHAREALREHWDRLHASDREPWPDERLIARFAKRHHGFGSAVESSGGPEALAQALQDAWGAFHAGEFQAAIEAGSGLGALGATIANKAAAVHTLNAKHTGTRELDLLDAAVKRGEAAVAVLPDYANAHYTLALALGRYSQGISILKALAAGIATRVRTHLEPTLSLEPRHAEAHVALGLYHAEIINKLGGLAASLTYGASSDAALEHFQKALKLAPHSPIVHIEYANGLMLLDADRHREEARALYAKAAAGEPADAMERLDIGRARKGID